MSDTQPSPAAMEAARACFDRLHVDSLGPGNIEEIALALDAFARDAVRELQAELNRLRAVLASMSYIPPGLIQTPLGRAVAEQGTESVIVEPIIQGE